MGKRDRKYRSRSPFFSRSRQRTDVVLTLERVRRSVLTGSNRTEGFTFKVKDKKGGEDDTQTFTGVRCDRFDVGDAMMHYREFKLQVESLTWNDEANIFKLFIKTLASTPLIRWNSALSALGDKKRDLKSFSKCVRMWLEQFLGTDDRRLQLEYCFDKAEINMQKVPCRNVREFSDCVDALVEYTNLLPKSKGGRDYITEMEKQRIFYDGQRKEWRSAYSCANLPQPETVKWADLIAYFAARETESYVKKEEENRAAYRGRSHESNNLANGGNHGRNNNNRNANGRSQNRPTNPNSKLSTSEVAALFRDARDDAKCPYHPNGIHTAGKCASNPKNADNKEFDKYRPGNKRGGNGNNRSKSGRRTESHVNEVVVEEVLDKDLEETNEDEDLSDEFFDLFISTVAESDDVDFIMEEPPVETHVHETKAEDEAKPLLPYRKGVSAAISSRSPPKSTATCSFTCRN
jgi:hypothetical protein